MGEPAELSQEERKAAIKLARDIVAAVRNDEPMPAPFHESGELEMEILQLAQVVELLIDRGRRLGNVYAAAITYARADRGRNGHREFIALRAECQRALNLENAEEADAKTDEAPR